MQEYDLLIVGSGGTGLLAGISALKQGIEQVLIIEKEENLGGNLNLFINNDFGEFYLGKKVPGPEFASMLIEEFISLGGHYRINSNVLLIEDDKVITYVNPTEGVAEVKAKCIILASGCKEKYTGNIIVPIHKYTGIFTTASAHRLVNFQGLLPGRSVVLSGNKIWTYILARRLVIEGAEVKAIITTRKEIEPESLDIIKDFKIPVILESEVVEVGGTERIELVKINNINDENSESIDCDSLILAIGYYPDLDYLKNLNLDMDGIFLKHNNYKTSIDGIYCCGTIIHGSDGILISGEEGYKVGVIASQWLKNNN